MEFWESFMRITQAVMLLFFIFIFLHTSTILAATVDANKRITFSTGDKLSKDALNSNFDILRQAIDGNAQDIGNLGGASYDYHDYLEPTTVSSKTFSATNSSGTAICTQQQWTLTRTTSAGETVVKQEETGCGPTLASYFRITASNYLWTQLDVDNAGINPWVFTTGIPALTSNMRVGQSWSEATFANYTSAGVTTSKLFLQNNNLNSTESMTLTINGSQTTYDNCLKIFTTFSSKDQSSITLNYQQISWYCPGIGLVKRARTYQRGTISDAYIITLTTTN